MEKLSKLSKEERLAMKQALKDMKAEGIKVYSAKQLRDTRVFCLED